MEYTSLLIANRSLLHCLVHKLRGISIRVPVDHLELCQRCSAEQLCFPFKEHHIINQQVTQTSKLPQVRFFFFHAGDLNHWYHPDKGGCHQWWSGAQSSDAAVDSTLGLTPLGKQMWNFN